MIFIHVPRTGGRSVRGGLISGSIETLDERIPKQRTGQGFVSHSTIQDYIDIFGEEEVEKEQKVTVVRNPWDRAFACWRFFVFPHNPIPFDQWLKEGGRFSESPCVFNYHLHPLDHMRYYKDNAGHVRMNLFLRFEHLAEDFKQLSDKPLPVVGEFGPTNYQEKYTEQWMIDFVAGLNTELINQFHYTF